MGTKNNYNFMKQRTGQIQGDIAVKYHIIFDLLFFVKII